jgi:hypothetical protein
MQWGHPAVIDQPATQPTIAATGDGGLLTAAEFNDGHGGQLRLDADVDASRIELGLHYHRDCQVDRQARGNLTGFRAWTTAIDPELGAAVERAAAAAGEQIGGNIGDRDHLRYRGRDYDLVEAQSRRGDFASWRVCLYDRAAGTAQRLSIVTHGGSRAFANPTATMLRDPAGRQAVMATLFVPMEARRRVRPARCSTTFPPTTGRAGPGRVNRSRTAVPVGSSLAVGCGGGAHGPEAPRALVEGRVVTGSPCYPGIGGEEHARRGRCSTSSCRKCPAGRRIRLSRA